MVAKVTFYWGKRLVLNGSVQAWWKAGVYLAHVPTVDWKTSVTMEWESGSSDRKKKNWLQAVPIQLRILIGLHEDPDNDERAKNHRILDMQTLDTRADKMFQVEWMKLWKNLLIYSKDGNESSL